MLIIRAVGSLSDKTQLVGVIGRRMRARWRRRVAQTPAGGV